jgi:class 3 adenylate cyclase
MPLKFLLFADQVSSTPNTAKRTRQDIERVAADQAALIEAVVRQCRGAVRNRRGDGVIATFEAGDTAVRCGAEIQSRVAARNAAQAEPMVQFELRIGVEMGEAIDLPDGEVGGSAINTAARVCNACPPGGVYLTEAVRQRLHDRDAVMEEVAAVVLKGISSPVGMWRLIKWTGPIEPTPNPFIWRARITDPGAIFDRKRETHTIHDYLLGRQNCQIVGPKRIGKSSLLRRIQDEAPKWGTSAVVAYVDLFDARAFTVAGLLRAATVQWAAKAPGTLASADGMIRFTEYVDELIENGFHPILCLDEFEELARNERRSQFTRDFFLTLRSCGQRGMSVITTSRKRLSELTEPGDPTSPFYNTFPYLPVERFSDRVAGEFVDAWRPGIPSFSSEERAAILAFAKGHPLALMVACFQVLETKEQGEHWTASMPRAAEDMRSHIPGW